MQHLDQLKNMVIMAAADGVLSEHEIALLIDRCSELGLKEVDLEKAIAFALSSEAALRLPTEKPKQLEMLGDLVRMMGADGKLTEVEKRLFAFSAAKMGVGREEINRIIDQLVGKS
jgi:uncharacterized tellurite resistance protein B-like protein